MSLRRRLEMIVGGPARPFPLTVDEAHSLACALDYYVEALRTVPAEQPGDETVDAQTRAELRELQARLYRHAGFGRLAKLAKAAV